MTFTGYLTGDEYWNRLSASSAIMVLTTYPFSLLGGAQEAMALGIPLNLSRQPALTEYFTRGAVFVDHSVDSIVRGLLTVQEREEWLKQDIAVLASESRVRWEAEFGDLLKKIGERFH